MLRKNKIWGEILVLPFIPSFPTFSVTWLYGIYNANKYLKRKTAMLFLHLWLSPRPIKVRVYVM